MSKSSSGITPEVIENWKTLVNKVYGKRPYDVGFEVGKRTGAIEELESLEDELQNMIDFNESCALHTDLYEAMGMVRDRLKKLKGEQNDG